MEQLLKNRVAGVLRSCGRLEWVSSQPDWILRYAVIQIGSSLLGLLLTPIVIMIQQYYIFDSPTVIIGNICDVLYIIDAIAQYYNLIPKNNKSTIYSFRSPSVGQLQRSKSSISTLFLRILCGASIVIAPLAVVAGVKPHVLGWICLCRLGVMAELPRKYRHFKQILEDRLVFIHETYSRVILAFILVILHSSNLACLWYYISCHSQDVTLCLNNNNWVSNDAVLDINSNVSKYFRSLYFVIQTLFTIGFGDIRPYNNSELIFTLFLIMNGSLFYAFLISSITSLLSNRDASTKLHRAETNVVSLYFRTVGIGSDLLERLHGYYEYLFTKKRGLLDSAILNALPISISSSAKLAFASKLESIPFFRVLQNTASRSRRMSSTGEEPVGPRVSTFIAACALRLEFRTAVPGERLLQQGEFESSLFIILSGKVDIMLEKSHCALLSLREGDHVGEQCLFLGGKSRISAQASEFTELLVLTRDSLERVIRDILNSKSTVTVGHRGMLCDTVRKQSTSAMTTGRRLSSVVDIMILNKRISQITEGSSPVVIAIASVDTIDKWIATACGSRSINATVSAAEDFHLKCLRVQNNIQTHQKKKMLEMLEKVEIGKVTNLYFMIIILLALVV